MAQLKDLLVAGDARVIGESSFNDKVTVAGLLTLSGGFSVNSNTTISGTVKYILGVNAFSSNVGSVIYQDIGTIVVGSAKKVENALTVNGKSYDGSKAVDVGTIGVTYGGTGISSVTANAGALIAGTSKNTYVFRAITNNTTATTAATGTNLITANTLYYALPKINNAKTYTSSSTFYAPVSGGTSGYTLVATGSTSTPEWTNVLQTVDTGIKVKGHVELDNATKFVYNSTDKCIDVIFN
jgi:hypothetical protein